MYYSGCVSSGEHVRRICTRTEELMPLKLKMDEVAHLYRR